MNLVDSYLNSNGYDYYGNAAEDTLVFFVHDEDAPTAGEPDGRSNEAVTNLSDNTVNGVLGGLSAEGAAANTETHAEAYRQKGGDNSTNFDISRDNAPADNEYSDAPASGSLSSPGSDADDTDFSDSVPKMQPMDEKQTDVKPDAGFKA